MFLCCGNHFLFKSILVGYVGGPSVLTNLMKPLILSLGYRNRAVDDAVEEQMLHLDTGTGPSARMVELAEKLVKVEIKE